METFDSLDKCTKYIKQRFKYGEVSDPKQFLKAITITSKMVIDI